ncbi:hypothetical protein F0562_026004 [Nyssa sinensis]|uniref:Peptidase C13 family protein n=1 Tax=Nyssa sinensis TaxID=561372 RepID=A0A5J5BBS5_9ASTE|nr:hypothetical protein F0562_026004 [Nyssa sinensis]
MYDDIAFSIYNPRPGVIINRPQGDDVYDGVPKDYTGNDTNVSNFFNVMLANKTAITGGSGKVLDSAPEDHIFIFFSDHGGPGVIGMPSDEYVYAKDLVDVLKIKHKANTYKSIVFYLESCESGSMFAGLLSEDLNIYVTTAANAVESSYGTYCPDDDPNVPPEYDTCLGDLYSVSWMEDSNETQTYYVGKAKKLLMLPLAYTRALSMPRIRDDDLGMSSPLMWLRGENGNRGIQSLNFQGIGVTPWMQPKLDASVLGMQGDIYQAIAAAALQDIRVVDPSKQASPFLLQFQQPQSVPNRPAGLVAAQMLQQSQPQPAFIQSVQESQVQVQHQPHLLQQQLQHQHSFTNQQQQHRSSNCLIISRFQVLSLPCLSLLQALKPSHHHCKPSQFACICD